MSDIALRVEGLSKRYRLGIQEGASGGMYRYKSLRDSLGNWTRHPLRTARQSLVRGPMTDDNAFWALKDVGFEVKKGEVVGIIGRNGAGKSTLLKILSRITKPTTGRVDLFGRVGSLLEVGTGFHPELTGRENIYLNGAILGMTRAEVRGRFDAIVAFSEVEKFLDSPVKQYSSGMYMRLAFAVAAHLEPEVLVVDEVLAVGDAVFQKKCLGKMRSVADEGRTVLFVSHQLSAIQSLCTRAIALDRGKIVRDGDARTTVSAYLAVAGMESTWKRFAPISDLRDPHFTAIAFSILGTSTRSYDGAIGADEEIVVFIEGEVCKLDPALTVGIQVNAPGGEVLFWAYHCDGNPNNWPEITVGVNRLTCKIPAHLLNEGEYTIELIASLHYRYWIYRGGVNAPMIKLNIQGGLSESPLFVNARPCLLAPILAFASENYSA